MNIGIAYDLKQDFHTEEGRPDDWLEEYDSEETVQAIQDVIEALGHGVVRLGGGRPFLERILATSVDLVFNLAEGSGARSRESQVPTILEMLEIPYTHSDPLTLALTLDKEMAKRVVASEGIPTPDFRLIRHPMDIEHIDLPFPLFVKPACDGSSRGIRSHSRVNDRETLRREIDRLFDGYGESVLVETFLPGREFTVGILGNDAPYILGVMEVAPAGGFVGDFVYCTTMKRECATRVRYRCPPEVPLSILQGIETVALGSYRVLGCRDVARVDIRLDRDGTPHFLEANPLPGIAPGYSDLVLLAGFVGWSYERLIETILSHAFERYGIPWERGADWPLVAGRIGRSQVMAFP
jgi:D-alanine-D-alanine ligase